MTAVVHALFRFGARRDGSSRAAPSLPAAALLALAWIGPCAGADARSPFSPVADRRGPEVDLVPPCGLRPGCDRPSERDVRPFEGTLGRPCGYRWRPTPSGTRRVRVCY